jgi:adenosine kinase
MSVVVTGSVAYDYIMFFPGRFRDHILPDKIDILSVSFLVDSLKRQRGGCATNIAYNLALLGERPVVMATVGQDFADYRAWLEHHGVDTSGIREIEGEFTASFFVSTDQSNSQIASFYTGAMSWARELRFRDLPHHDIHLAVISPNDPEAMRCHVRECQELGIPYIYDPSQQIIRLSAEDLIEGTRGARVLIVNDYEYEMIKKKTGLTNEEICSLAPAVIVTRGEEGSTIMEGEEIIEIPAVPPTCLADPTGVGDAYRAGIIKGLVHDLPWSIAGRIASLAATYVLEAVGTQNHSYTPEDFVQRYTQAFGPSILVERLFAQEGV